jgi:restriction system protein
MWEHEALRRELSLDFVTTPSCHFCGAILYEVRHEIEREGADEDDIVLEVWQTLRTCLDCGWWAAFRDENSFFDKLRGSQAHILFGAAGGLKNLDLHDISLPIDEIRTYLVGRFEKRFEVHPRIFEETVASVFRNLGYTAIATAYSGDGGIDVVLNDSTGTEIGVQVKRWRDSIKVEQIRALTGALLIAGYTRGIFITTSKFQTGAQRVADAAGLKGYFIDLVDSDRFLQILRVANRQSLQASPEQLILEGIQLKVLRYQSLSCHWDGPVVVVDESVESHSNTSSQPIITSKSDILLIERPIIPHTGAPIVREAN